MKYQSLRQIFKITEWKDGCVYKTKQVGYAWLTIDHNPSHDGNLQFHSVSTDLMKKLNHRTNRTVSDETPDMVITTLQELGVN